MNDPDLRKLKIGIDVGGTFTHAVAVDVARTELVGKAVVPTTHDHEDGVAAGVVQSMHRLLEETGIAPEEVVLIAHSTTQATNALLEGDVAKVGVLALGSGPQGLRARREAGLGSVPLGPGATLETAFRFVDTAQGLDEDAVRVALQELVDEGARALVAAAPFSVDRPENEEAVGRIAGELGVSFLRISAPEVVSGMSGESEAKVRSLFKEAREQAPAIVFIDEIDAIAPKRETAQREMERRIVAQLLTCMDELNFAATGGQASKDMWGLPQGVLDLLSLNFWL